MRWRQQNNNNNNNNQKSFKYYLLYNSSETVQIEYQALVQGKQLQKNLFTNKKTKENIKINVEELGNTIEKVCMVQINLIDVTITFANEKISQVSSCNSKTSF